MVYYDFEYTHYLSYIVYRAQLRKDNAQNGDIISPLKMARFT